MFHGVTVETREVMTDAVDRARRDRAPEVDEAHLLAALIAAPSLGPLLDRIGLPAPEAAGALKELREARRRGGLGAADAEALADLGIDLDLVVTRIEADLGAGALDVDRRRRWRRRLRLPLSAGSKRALEAGFQQAVLRGHCALGAEHVLLGLAAGRGLVADVLAGRGVTVATLLAALDDAPTSDPRP